MNRQAVSAKKAVIVGLLVLVPIGALTGELMLYRAGTNKPSVIKKNDPNDVRVMNQTVETMMADWHAHTKKALQYCEAHNIRGVERDAIVDPQTKAAKDAIAKVRQSGYGCLRAALSAFAKRLGTAKMALSIGVDCPTLDGAMQWLNKNDATSGPVIPESRPVLVYFWAMSCPACKSTMPDLQALRDKYAPLGLQTVAVHSPRGDFDIDANAVAKMASELGMTELCAIDDKGKIAEAFQINAWPTYFVFGANHKLKVRAAGGFGVKMCASALRNVFGESQT